MTDTSVCKLYEFVPFFSYTHHRRSGIWDPSQGNKVSSLLASYDRVISLDPQWREVLREDKTDLMIFDCKDSEWEFFLAEQYINNSVPVWNNERWLVLKPNLTIIDN